MVHLIAGAIASLLRCGVNVVPTSFWGYDMQCAVDGADLSSATSILRFVRQQLDNALSNKLGAGGENSLGLISEMKSSPSSFEAVLDAPVSLTRNDIGTAVGSNNLSARPNKNDNHDWSNTNSKAQFFLHKKSGDANKVWVLNIVKGLSFDFSDLHNCCEICTEYTDATGAIAHKSWSLPDYFSQDVAREDYMKAYARWGQLAWHGWHFKSSDPADEHHLHIYVWPVVKDASNESVNWSDLQHIPQNLLESSALISSGGSPGSDCWSSMKMWHFASLGQDNGKACPSDILWLGSDADELKPKRVTGTSCSNNEHTVSMDTPGCNAAHEFGHLIQISHTCDKMSLMFGGSACTGVGNALQKNTAFIATDDHREMTREVSMRPHILWVEKMIEEKTGNRIRWVRTR